MSKRPLTRRVGLCYIAAAGLQHCGAAAAGSTTTVTTAVDDDIDIVSLGAMQPPLTNHAHSSSFGLAGRPRPAETSFGKEESPDQTLSRLLQHTFGSLGSALDDTKLDPNMLPFVDEIDGTVPTRKRSAEEDPSRVVLEEDEGQQPASLGAAGVEKLAGVVEAEPEEEEEEGAGEGEEEERGRGEEKEGDSQAMSVGTGFPPELGSQQEGAVSTESHSGQASEVGDAANGTTRTAVVAVTAEAGVDAGIAGEGTDAAIKAGVALEDVSETGAALAAVAIPVCSADSPPEPGIREASGAGVVEKEEVGDAPTGATVSGKVEAFGEGGLGQHLGGGTTASEEMGAFGEGGLGKHGEGGATKSEEVTEAFSLGGVLGEHRGGSVPATGDLIGQENEIGESGPVVPGDAPLTEDGGLARTADGTDPIQFSPVADTGATEEVATSGDAAGTGALAGGGGGADNAGVEKDSTDIGDASDGSAGQAGLEVPELGVEVAETDVPGGAVDGGLGRHEGMPVPPEVDWQVVPPEVDGQVGALEAEAAAPISSGVQEPDASEGDHLAEVLPDDTIGVVEGSEAGDRSEPPGLVTSVPLAGTEVNAGAETTGDAQEHSTTAAVGAMGGTDSGEALTGSAEDDGSSRTGSSDAPAGSNAERDGAGGQGAVEHGRGAEALEPPEPAKGGGPPEDDAAAAGLESDGAREVGVGEVAGSPLGGVGEPVGSASEPSETDALPEDRLRPDDAPAGEGAVVGDVPRDAADTPTTPPTSSEGGNDKTGGLGAGGGSEEESPRERRVFRFSEPPGSRAPGESAGLPGMPGDASSSDRAKKFSMPPIKPIDVSPDALQKFRVPEDSPGEAGIEGTEVWSAWGKRWAGVAVETAVQVAKVAGGRGGTAASSGLQFCKAQTIKAWHEVVEPRTEHVRQQLETVAMAGLDEVGVHLADPVLAEAI